MTDRHGWHWVGEERRVRTWTHRTGEQTLEAGSADRRDRGAHGERVAGNRRSRPRWTGRRMSERQLTGQTDTGAAEAREATTVDDTGQEYHLLTGSKHRCF